MSSIVHSYHYDDDDDSGFVVVKDFANKKEAIEYMVAEVDNDKISETFEDKKSVAALLKILETHDVYFDVGSIEKNYDLHLVFIIRCGVPNAKTKKFNSWSDVKKSFIAPKKVVIVKDDDDDE